MAKAHQNKTKTFEELSFAEQAKSISALVQYLEKAINANVKRSIVENRVSPATARIGQVERLIQRLKKKHIM